jgi:transcriptional regulator with XRE-family HTH domain
MYFKWVSKSRPHTTETLARNLNFLMEKYGYSEKEMERRSKVSAKTINNMRNAKHTATIENTEKVAAVFGLSGWQLIVPGLAADLVESKDLSATMANYAAADDEGRKAIARLAEREAQYNTKK